MTIDVAKLRRWASGPLAGLTYEELAELLDAYEERDRLRAFWDEMRAFREWADRQFPNSTPQSKAHHLAKEAHELAADPQDPEEMADVLGIFAHLADWEGVDLTAALRAKRLKNEARKWGEPDENGVIEHLRTGGPR